MIYSRFINDDTAYKMKRAGGGCIRLDFQILSLLKMCDTGKNNKEFAANMKVTSIVMIMLKS